MHLATWVRSLCRRSAQYKANVGMVPAFIRQTICEARLGQGWSNSELKEGRTPTLDMTIYEKLLDGLHMAASSWTLQGLPNLEAFCTSNAPAGLEATQGGSSQPLPHLEPAGSIADMDALDCEPHACAIMLEPDDLAGPAMAVNNSCRAKRALEPSGQMLHGKHQRLLCGRMWHGCIAESQE
jgi:hypothetical protein